jgi:predicted flap endonuclease-1-like 5' DNA nuclease
MAKQSFSNDGLKKTENPFLVMSELSFQSATYMTDMWLGAMRGFIDASQSALQPTGLADVAPVQKQAGQKQEAKKSATKASSQTADKSSAPNLAADAPLDVGAADDLKKISGVGPKLEQLLNKKGISTYGQIVAMSKTEIVDMSENLGFPGRIERDDWVGQAKALIAG